jgi:hypothetical protein
LRASASEADRDGAADSGRAGYNGYFSCEFFHGVLREVAIGGSSWASNDRI